MTAHERPTEIRTHHNGALCCPSCGFEYLHIDRVAVAARREDDPFNNIEIDAITGRVQTHGPMPETGTEVGVGRRHRIVLIAECEGCTAEPQLILTQHKGQTFVEWSVQPNNESEEN